MTYSVAESWSTSTPRSFFGRSLICPSDASTSKPEPRYFWIVFAFVGDSTMTKPFANSYLDMTADYVMKLAWLRRKRQNCRLRFALSPSPSNRQAAHYQLSNIGLDSSSTTRLSEAFENPAPNSNF